MELRQKTVYISRYAFSDFFDRTFKMAGHTGKTSLIASISLFVPIAVVYELMLHRFFRAVAGLLGAQPDQIHALFGPYAGLVALSILSIIALSFVSTAVSANAAIVVSGRKVRTREVIAVAWKRYFGRVFLQHAIKISLFAGIGVGMAVPFLLVGVFSLSADHVPLVVILAAVVWTAGLLCLLTWLSTLLFLSPIAVVFDDESVFGSLRRSAQLVRDNWWRLFGTILLSNLIFSFSIGLITYPIIGASMLPRLSELLQTTDIFGGNTQGSTVYVRLMMDAMSSAGPGIALATLVQGVCYSLIFPVLWSLFYVDLKVRLEGMPRWNRVSALRARKRGNHRHLHS